MIFPLADQISVQKTPSTNSSRRRPQRLSKSLTSSAVRGRKRANVQRIAKLNVKSRSDWLSICEAMHLQIICNIHFQKYPIFLEKIFKYNRNSKRLGCDLK